MRSALGLCLLLALASCDSFASRFQCQRDAQCVRPSMTGGAGEAGLCLASSCAFPAPECPVLLRYDVSASPERVGQCVSPAPSDPRFRPVVDPDGTLVLPPLTLWFPGPSPQNAAAGRVGAAYLSTFDRESRSAAGDPAMGTSRLYRLDPERANLTELTSPEPGAALRLGVSSPVGLFVASASRLYYSPDGLRFTTRAPLALQGLAHDGELLYLLADGGLFATTGDEESLIPIPRPGAAGERVVGLLGGLSGAGPVLALTRQTGADGVSTTTTAAGLTFVSEVDKHTLHAFDSATGKPAWHFIAGGRIVSPPAYWKGRVFFGGKDGLVYCLRATDGALIWRFQAAPVMLSHGAWEMMESVWPVDRKSVV